MNVTVDGDLFCLMAFNDKGQKLLQNFDLPNLTEAEKKWIVSYIQGEYETTYDLDLTKPSIFRIHKLYSNATNALGVVEDRKNYSQILLNSSVAKGNIGPATLDIWALTIILECYQAYWKKNNGKYIKGKHVKTLRETISDKDLYYLSFVYTFLVQDRVIEAIKHMENGSASFKMYFLTEMPNNLNAVGYQLRKDFDVPEEYINKLLYVIAWAHDSNLLTAARNFISIHNKGRFPRKMEAFEEWKEFIQENSYFGKLVEPLFDIHRNIKTVQAAQAEESENSSDELAAMLAAYMAT